MSVIDPSKLLPLTVASAKMKRLRDVPLKIALKTLTLSDCVDVKRRIP